MPIPDHASLNLALTIDGLTSNEMAVVVNNLPAGTTADIAIHKQAIGGKRFEVSAEGLSIQGAQDVVAALRGHLDAVASEGYCPQCVKRCEGDHGPCWVDGKCTEDFAYRGRQDGGQ